MKAYRLSILERSKEKIMVLPEMNNKERSALDLFRVLAAGIVVMILTFAGIAADAAVKQKGFASPEEAVKAVMTAARNNNDK